MTRRTGSVAEDPTMTTKNDTPRMPRSMRKYLRRRKAALRRELSEKEAERAIERLEREARHRR